jgi:hypothetical protein
MLVIGVACAGGSGGGPVGTPSAGPGGGLVACEALNKLQRYRYTYRFQISSPQPETTLDETQVGIPTFALPPNNPDFEFGQEFEGSVVAPDRIRQLVKNEGQPDLEIVFIGDQSWTYVGSSGPWQSTGPVPPSFTPDKVCNAVLSAPDFEGAVPATEQLNGAASRHYRFDGVEAETAGVLLGPVSDMGRLLKEYDVDVWLSEDGWPIRLETSSEGTYPSGRKLFIELALEIKDVNAIDIEVEPPI